MASVQNASIYQEARDRVEEGINRIIQCLNERKTILFREIAVLENECGTKQQQKLNSLRKLESLRDHTEEQLGDNLLTEIQDRVTQEIQKGIHKMNLEVHSATVDYSIQVDWTDRVNDIKERIKRFHIVKVPKSFYPQYTPAKKSKKKTRPYTHEGNAWTSRRYGNDRSFVEPNWGDATWGDDTWGDD